MAIETEKEEGIKRQRKVIIIDLAPVDGVDDMVVF